MRRVPFNLRKKLGNKLDELEQLGQAEQNSFDRQKKFLANAETLGYYENNAQTQVIADASPVGLGAMLTQKQGDD